MIEKPDASVRSVKLILGDSFKVMAGFDEGSIRAVVTDPPYLINFMGQEFDSQEGIHQDPKKMQAWHEGWLKEAYRVLVPGGVIKAFSATRTFHRLAMAMRNVGYQGLHLEAWSYGCLSEDTEILTEKGWAHYRDAQVGCQVLGFDVVTGKFSWQAVEETFEYPCNGTAYSILGEHTDQIVSTGHRCVIWNDGWKFVRSEDLTGTEALFPCLENVSDMRQSIQDFSVPYVATVLQGMQKDLLSEQTENHKHSSRERVRSLPQNVSAKERNIQDLQSEMCLQTESSETETFIGTQVHRTSMLSVRENVLETQCLDEKESSSPSLFPRMQWREPGERLGETRIQRNISRDPCWKGLSYCKDDGAKQPGLERGGYVPSLPRESCGSKLHSVPSGIQSNGPERRVRDGAQVDGGQSDWPSSYESGDCPSSESYGTGQPDRESGSVCLEPGTQAIRGQGVPFASMARIEAIHYSGLIWCVRVGTGSFVARRKGHVFVTGNSGFPKSLNISKALDRASGSSEDREVVDHVGADEPQTVNRIALDFGGATGKAKNGLKDGYDVTLPATEIAKELSGFGTALKPAWEPFVCGRKPS